MHTLKINGKVYNIRYEGKFVIVEQVIPNEHTPIYVGKFKTFKEFLDSLSIKKEEK